MSNLKWAIVGPGGIAHQFAEAMAKEGREVYAVGARNKGKGEAFAKEYGIGIVYDDFDALFADNKIDAVYISTPHSNHYEFMMKAVQNGKHILVEKAITVSSRELEDVLRVSREKKGCGYGSHDHFPHAALCEAEGNRGGKRAWRIENDSSVLWKCEAE